MADRALRLRTLGLLSAARLRWPESRGRLSPILPGCRAFLATTGIVGMVSAGGIFAACFSLLTQPWASGPAAGSLPIEVPLPSGPGRISAGTSAMAPPAVIERSAIALPVSRSGSSMPPSLSAGDIGRAIELGDEFFRDGDLAVARFFFEQAALAGDGQAALRAGETFDPAFLKRGRGRGDLPAALHWYEVAMARGIAAAVPRVARLDTAMRR